jgi:uncharacterized Zn-finger protein
MKKHVLSVHEGKKVKKLYKCDICDNRYSYKGSMRKHVLSVHEGYKQFKCDACDLSCSQISDMIFF